MCLRSTNIRAVLAAGLGMIPALGLAQQLPAAHAHAPEGRTRLRAGMHALPLLTRATPTAGAASITEGYLSQPALLGMASAFEERVGFMVMANLEGLTLARGELTTGAYGEGYVDRRHPHAYLHEAIATWRSAPTSPRAISLSAGRGFATFGSDDPMVRPFVKYPVNHHLAQVLERGLLAGAARLGRLGVEVSLFNGEEPARASDLPTLARIGDSWAARATLYPLPGIELSASRAIVASPEVKAGFGVDSHKWHAAARAERGAWYGLAEWARSTEHDAGAEGASYASALAEAAYRRAAGTVALRLEQTDRHEEERLENLFRTAPATGGSHAIARTRWRTVTLHASRRFDRWGGFGWSPFVELAVAEPALRSGVLFDPREFYGARRLAMLSAGARVTAGTWHVRMGRYGAAAATSDHGH